MIKVSIPKALETRLRKATESGPIMEHAGSIVRQLISILDDAHDKRTRKAENAAGGINPHDVIKAVKGILGGKASVPPNPGNAYYGYIAQRVKFLNVSLQDIETAATHVRTGSQVVKLPTSVEWFMRKLDMVLEEMEGAEGETKVDEWVIMTGR